MRFIALNKGTCLNKVILYSLIKKNVSLLFKNNILEWKTCWVKNNIFLNRRLYNNRL